MALRFGWKKSEDAPGTPDIGKQAEAFEPQPDTARKWFAHAKAAAERYNYDYALTCYANGVRLDPSPMSVHEEMFQAAVKYVDGGGKPAAGKEVKKLEGPHPVQAFAAAEYAWFKDLNNAALAIKFLEAAIEASQWVAEVGRWQCPRILNVIRRQKKPSKSLFITAKDLFPRLGAWDEALAAGEEALRLDPQDAQLQNELKDLSAQRAMDQGRYEEAGGAEGGFRKFVKDIDKQRELEDAEALSGGLDVGQRNLMRARAEYEKSPQLPDVINQYGQLLKAVGTDEARQTAYGVFMKGYEDTGQYRFRMAAGDIRIDEAAARVKALEDGDQRDAARRELLDLQHEEYIQRVKEYPTDRKLRQRLGEVELEMGLYAEATKSFQEAKDDPKVRVRAGHLLGRCFAAEGWHDIAIAEFKEALERLESGDREQELNIRYDLMVSLMEHARTEQSMDLAREALEISSSIARKDITYRDIRNRRKQADELIKELGGAAPSDG